jgi:hypothetical protein
MRQWQRDGATAVALNLRVGAIPPVGMFSDFNEDCSDQLATIVDRLKRWFL